MKKNLAGLTAAFYLYSFTLCLCYAAVTGEVHPGVGVQTLVPSPAQGEHGQGECHHGQESEQGQAHHDRNAPDACCIKFLQDLPGLWTGTPARLLLDFDSYPHLLPVPAFDLDTWQDLSFFRNHSPPGFAPQDPLLASLSPRAPPAC